jgi:hypothetical protein
VNDVAGVDTDTEVDALGLGPIGVAVRHCLLNHDGAVHGVDRGELDQDAVAGGLEDAVPVLGDQRVDQFGPCAFEEARVPSSSVPISREYPATSAQRIAASRLNAFFRLDACRTAI